jgi:hypothetical protein
MMHSQVSGVPRLQHAYNEAVLAYAGEGGLLDPARHGQTFAMCKVLGMAASTAPALSECVMRQHRL